MPGTITQSHAKLGNVGVLTLTCTADAAAATYPTAVLESFEGRLLALETNPGATGPTDNYDIAITDDDGLDVLQGVGQNRDITNTEIAAIVYAATADHPYVDESMTLTIAITNNAVNSAVVVIRLIYEKV